MNPDTGLHVNELWRPVLNKFPKCNNKTKQLTNGCIKAHQLHTVLGSPAAHRHPTSPGYCLPKTNTHYPSAIPATKACLSLKIATSLCDGLFVVRVVECLSHVLKMSAVLCQKHWHLEYNVHSSMRLFYLNYFFCHREPATFHHR